MTTAYADSTRRLSVRQTHGRVINEIAAFLRRRLEVPNLFIKPRIPGASGLDLLAVDGAGSGDAHGVEIRPRTVLPTRSGIRELIAPLKTLPVHYRYLAIQANESSRSRLVALREYDELFDRSGIGRIGILSFDERLLQREAVFDPALLSLVVTPERFLVRGDKLAALEKYLKRAQPDMHIRI